MEISVVVPVYGCRAALEELHMRLVTTLKKITQCYEIIFVNDACPQNSWEVIEKICLNDKNVKGIELSRNFGQIKATTAGVDYSSGDWVVVLDCDLQDKPEEIINLYNKAMEGYDVVIARREKRQDSRVKTFVSKIFYKIYSFASEDYYDPALCNFSIMNRNVADYYCKMRELHRGFTIYLKWLGFRHATINVEHNERKEGKSSYTMKKRIQFASELLTSQSDKILRFTVYLGFIITLLSFLAIIILVIRYFTLDIASGWTSLIASQFLMGGIILTSIGVVGIYVGNTFMQVKQRPLYVIRQILNDDKSTGKEGTA